MARKEIDILKCKVNTLEKIIEGFKSIISKINNTTSQNILNKEEYIQYGAKVNIVFYNVGSITTQMSMKLYKNGVEHILQGQNRTKIYNFNSSNILDYNIDFIGPWENDIAQLRVVTKFDTNLDDCPAVPFKYKKGQTLRDIINSAHGNTNWETIAKSPSVELFICFQKP